MDYLVRWVMKVSKTVTKTTKENNKKIQEIEKVNDYKDIGMIAQLVSMAGVLYFYILNLFLKENVISSLVYFLLCLLMFIMAFNNHTTYKRKYFTLIYLIIGIMSVFIGIVI